MANKKVADGYVINRYCDVAMAKSKGLIGKRTMGNVRKCEGNCTSCMACVEILSNGDKRHVTVHR